MDEFEFKNRAKLRKTKPRDMPWSPKILGLVRDIVLQEFRDDFVIVMNIAHELKIQLHEAGSCLNVLVDEGIVLSRRPISPFDQKGEPVEINFSCPQVSPFPVSWNGTEWVQEYKNYKVSRKTGRIRQGTETIDEQPVRDAWDGTGYYVIRGEEFRNACKERGFPEDPVRDPWTCSKCGKENTNDHNRKARCYDYKCGTLRYPESENTVIEKPTCPRCGSVIPFRNLHGKRRADHPLKKCNLALVKHVLEV